MLYVTIQVYIELTSNLLI